MFRRPSGYNPGDDNIVRNYARHLRRRLAEYFESEGNFELLHIRIPVGGYIPVFESASSGATHQETPSLSIAASPAEDPVEIPQQAFTPHAPVSQWKYKIRFTALRVVYSAALIVLTWIVIASPVTSRLATWFHLPFPTVPTKPLWTALFDGPANCYIVPADTGFNILEDISHHPLSLADYVKGSYLDVPLSQMDGHSAEDLRAQFTSFTDLQIIVALAGLPSFNPEHVILRFPRQLQIDDLKDSNAIILGSTGSNPWTSIVQNNANFRIVNGEAMQAATIVNTRPLPGEAASYESHWNQPAHETYAIIAYLPNLAGSGHILLLQGLDVAGTQAAAETLIHPAAITPILQQATRLNGSLHSFEILIRSSSIASHSAGSEVIASRIYQD